MSSTAYQWIFDYAESIEVDKSATVSQTISRSNTVRTVSRGGQTWRFKVRVPDGMPWLTMRPLIEETMAADRVTVANVAINDAGYSDWLFPYQGDCSNSVQFIAAVYKGFSNIELTANATISSGDKFKAGDIVQIGTGNVYTIANSVSSSSNVVILNRPVRDEAGIYNLRVGNNVFWKLILVEMPTFTIGGTKQVFWSGDFVFYEATDD